jgi:predicted MFS family arabinose efflux permease
VPSASPIVERERQNPGDAAWIVVVACGVIAAMHVWKLPTALTEVRADLSIDLVEAGLLLALVQLAGMLGGLPASLFGERVGLRRAMAIGLVLLVAGTAVSATAPSFGVLMGGRVLEGIGFLTATVVAPALIRRDTAFDRATLALGFWAAFQGMATFTALLGSSLLLQVADWRTWYWVMAALTAVGIPLLLKYVPPDPSGQGGTFTALGRVWISVRSWKPWVAGLIFACYTIQWMAVIAFLPTVYEGYGISTVVGGGLSAVAGGLNAVGAVLAGVLLRRGFGVRQLVITAFVIMTVTAFGVYAPNWSSWDGAFIAQFVLVCIFSCIGALVPASLTRIAVDLAPQGGSPAAVIGLMQQIYTTGNFVGPTLLAWLAAQAGGWHTSWWLSAAFGSLGVVLVLVLSERQLGMSLRDR